MVATIIPFGSEVYFITLLSLEKYNHFILFLVASVGNVLGSLFNWICGFYINFFIKKSWFPINNKIIDRGNKLFIKYGKWSLLISWFPLIGDPITFAAGTFRYPIIPFFSFGKYWESWKIFDNILINYMGI
jgi:membrane protein YqaA with SNARE-associated domain